MAKRTKKRAKSGGAQVSGKIGDESIDLTLEGGKIVEFNKSEKSDGGYKSCRETHPALPLGDGLVIYGGSCIKPVVKDADVYIGFDGGMDFTKRHFPWNQGEEVYFKITDGQAPGNVEEFKKLVEWTAQQLMIGKKVHAGCIGGHGRTGTFFAALASVMLSEEDAITYVRENYCKKAVESQVQINFLHKHFGIKKAKPSKPGVSYSNSTKWEGWDSWSPGKGSSVVCSYDQSTGTPIKTPGSIWGSHLD